ncbi:MAG TPA: hypothetical protein VF916_10465, partial [Ktedonobacterales bacterium]
RCPRCGTGNDGEEEQHCQGVQHAVTSPVRHALYCLFRPASDAGPVRMDTATAIRLNAVPGNWTAMAWKPCVDTPQSGGT